MGIALDDLDALSDAELAVRISLGLLEEAYQSHACHTSEVAKTYSSCAVAHTNLGYLLINKGEFRQAAEILRRAHQFGSKNPFWPYLSAQWVQNCERLVEVKGRLLAIGSRSDPKVIWKGGR